MTSDHSTPRCLRCPDTALRLIDRGAFAVSRDAAPLPAAIRDSAFLAANVLTGAFNLLPIPPLDGAQMVRCLLQSSSK